MIGRHCRPSQYIEVHAHTHTHTHTYIHTHTHTHTHTLSILEYRASPHTDWLGGLMCPHIQKVSTKTHENIARRPT